MEEAWRQKEEQHRKGRRRKRKKEKERKRKKNEKMKPASCMAAHVSKAESSPFLSWSK
jgi:hypothetical protein